MKWYISYICFPHFLCSEVLDIVGKHQKDAGVQEAAIRTIKYLAMSSRFDLLS